MKKVSIFLVLSVLSLMASSAAMATPITPTPWGSIDPGTQIAGPHYSDFIFDNGSTSYDVGDLKNCVWQNNGTYTYIEVVSPDPELKYDLSISKFSTGFGVNGFNGVAGIVPSLSDAGVTGSIYLDDLDGSIHWEVTGGSWDSGETMALFYQSTLPPGEPTASYYLTGTGKCGGTGTAVGYSYAPVPEPGTLVMLGTGLLGLAGLRRRFRK